MDGKRRDITPKKDENSCSKKRYKTDVIIIDNDSDDEKFKTSTHSRRRFCDDEDDSDDPPPVNFMHTATFVNTEATSNEKLEEGEVPFQQFYNRNPNLPLLHKRNPDVQEIFDICLGRKFPVHRLVSEKPLRIKETATFIVDQNRILLKHPYDLDADDTPGAFEKKENVRFYVVRPCPDGGFDISSEVHVVKDKDGRVTYGGYNIREKGRWRMQE